MRWGNYRISYIWSKGLDNVGEFFFSSRINNFNIWQQGGDLGAFGDAQLTALEVQAVAGKSEARAKYGRSNDDQRHRLVFNGTVHSSLDKAGTPWQRISHGFQVSVRIPYICRRSRKSFLL